MLFKSWWVDLWFCLCSSSWNVRCITARQLNTRSNRLQSKQMNMNRTIANATEGNGIEYAVEYIFAVAEMSVRCVMHNSHAYAPVQREYVTCGCVQIYSTENRKWLKYNMQQVAPILHSLCYSLSIARDVLDWLQWVSEPWALLRTTSVCTIPLNVVFVCDFANTQNVSGMAGAAAPSFDGELLWYWDENKIGKSVESHILQCTLYYTIIYSIELYMYEYMHIAIFICLLKRLFVARCLCTVSCLFIFFVSISMCSFGLVSMPEVGILSNIRRPSDE